MTQQEDKTITLDKPQTATPEKITQKKDSKREPFFKTLPGILTGIAAVLTAIGGVITGLTGAGIIGPDARKSSIAETGLYVISTTPENHATNVNADVTEIVVEFNGELVKDSYSLVMSDLGVTPNITGDPTFPEKNTCVIPVSLEAGTTYALGLNDSEHINFRSAEDESVSAEPYVLVFNTK